MMIKKEFFPPLPSANPTIYAYELLGAELHKGLLKIGFTDRDAQTRVKEQLGTPALEYQIVLEESAMRNDGTGFRDQDIHAILKRWGIEQYKNSEYYRCTLNDVLRAIELLRNGKEYERLRTQNFDLRPEQLDAVEKTAEYFKQ